MVQLPALPEAIEKGPHPFGHDPFSMAEHAGLVHQS
jgi:hypothetical protein